MIFSNIDIDRGSQEIASEGSRLFNCRYLSKLFIVVFGGLCLGFNQAKAQSTPIHQWIFDQSRVNGTSVDDETGGLDGSIQGAFEWATNPSAISLTGAGYVELAAAMDTSLMPKSALSIEQWVMLRDSGSWPGFASCLQDNGSYERGWWIGANGSKFLFALAADTTLTYMYAPTTFELNKWYHVVGTYDGTTMKLYVNGQSVAQSTAESGDINYSTAPFVLGAYKDDNETYAMNGCLRESALYNVALTDIQVKALYDAQSGLFEKFEPPLGPFVRFNGSDQAVVTWQTATEQPSVLEYSGGSVANLRVLDATPKKSHAVVLSGLDRKTEYSYVLMNDAGAGERPSAVYLFETDFHYRVTSVPDRPSPFPVDGKAVYYASAAQAILAQAGTVKGYALDFGGSDARLAYEIVKQSELNVIIVNSDTQMVSKLRSELHAAGVYGSRVSVIHSSLDDLPFTGKWFNLIVSSGLLSGTPITGTADEMLRVLRPEGVALLGLPNGVLGELTSSPDAWVRETISANDATITTDENRMTMVTRLPLPGAGEWTHNFGDPGQTCSSNDQRIRGTEMKVQWFGDPGPRGFTDRQARNPTPLMTGGTLYVQGNNRVSAQDAFNGRLHWSIEIPGARRVNMPRDGGNWCADKDSLFLAHHQNLLRLDGYTGELMQHYEVPLSSEDYDWGYVATVGDKVYGSCVKKGSFYTQYDGSWEFWYDSTTALNEIAKICSDQLFCLNKDDGSVAWSYDGGVVINNTISIGGGRVYFIDCRKSTIKNYASGRIDSAELFQENYLVALDSQTGALIWEKPLAVPASTYPVVLYLCYNNEKLVMLSSTTKYYVFGYSAVDGTQLWNKEHNWNRNHHGGHLYHPVIIGDLVIAEPYAYNLATGAVEKSGLPVRGGCSTMSASANTVHYINWDYSKGAPYFWDLDTDHRRQMAGTRSSCWLSVISGGGMIMLPPASAGCACRFPIQSSIIYSAP